MRNQIFSLLLLLSLAFLAVGCGGNKDRGLYKDKGRPAAGDRQETTKKQ